MRGYEGTDNLSQPPQEPKCRTITVYIIVCFPQTLAQETESSPTSCIAMQDISTDLTFSTRTFRRASRIPTPYWPEFSLPVNPYLLKIIHK